MIITYIFKIGIYLAMLHLKGNKKGVKSNFDKKNSRQPCAKISFNSFLFLLSNKMLVIKARTCKMLVRIANREEDPDQTASSEAV